jgi:glycosyltransferase involved in cell wall biosynthesis
MTKIKSKKAKKRKKYSIHQGRGNSKSPFKGSSPISLCMIVKNEERFLQGCLESVQGLVNEIIIVDTGSTDKTVEIAEKFNCSIFHFIWKNNFAAARNYALSKCTLPWVLYLDADERLPKEFHEAILSEVKANRADAIYLKVHSSVSGILGNVPHIQAYPRLFKKLNGAKFEGRIHEQITPSLKRLNAQLKYLDVTIEHLGYAQEDEILSNKIKRNLGYLEEQVSKEPNNAYAFFQLGQTLLLNKQREKGIECLEKSLSLKQLPNNLTSTSLLMISNELFKEENYNEALKYIKQALELAPRQRIGYFLKSECHAKRFEWEEALGALDKMLEYSDLPFSDISIEKNFNPYLIEQRKGLYYFNLQDYQPCLEHLFNYFKIAPVIRENLVSKWIEAWQKDGAFEFQGKQLLYFFREHLDKVDQKEELAKALAGVAEICHTPDDLAYFLKLALKFDSHDPMTLYYLGNLELEKGNMRTAESYFLKSLKEKNDVWEIHYNLAVTKIRQNLFQPAIDVLENALKIFPEKTTSTNRLLGGLYAKIGNFDKVLEQLNPVITE